MTNTMDREVESKLIGLGFESDPGFSEELTHYNEHALVVGTEGGVWRVQIYLMDTPEDEDPELIFHEGAEISSPDEVVPFINRIASLMLVLPNAALLRSAC